MTSAAPTRDLEIRLKGEGYALIAGMDEVGRGALASPLAVGVVVLPEACELPLVRDSKLLSPKQRIIASQQIQAVALGIGVGWASPAEIDELGLSQALQLAGVRAIRQLATEPDLIVLDGKHSYLPAEVATHLEIKADQSCLAVAAASVVAKVARDAYLTRLHELHPHYDWAGNKGYGAKSHLNSLSAHGTTKYHRHSYKPVAARSGKR